MTLSNTTEELRDIGPLGQSIAYAFRFLFIAVCVIAAGWLFSNIHQIPPDSQAVVIRFGAVAHVQGPGLLIAWPKPIERVVVLPGHDRQIPLQISAFTEAQSQDADTFRASDLDHDPRLNAAFLLTGDSAVVHLQAQLFYQITNPAAYMTSADHIAPALQRMFVASAISIVAGRDLDSILVARPEIASRANEAGRRGRLRTDLVNAVNRRLDELSASNAELGVRVSRIDLVPSIPAGAKFAFDNVLVVIQTAQTSIANANTNAQLSLQNANREKDRTFTDATAAADELVSEARVQTASIAAVSQEAQGMSREMQLSRLYYDRINKLLHKSARVEVVDQTGAVHVLMTGAPK